VSRAVRPRPDLHDDDARGERGTITLWILGLCLMLFALGGISLDLWRAFSDRRSLASAADAAAVAGGTALDVDAYRHDGVVQLDPALAKARAEASLRDQGDTSALTNVSVDADTQTVRVTVYGATHFSLLQLLPGAHDFSITVHASARPQASP
jgi:Flp pilus assembly protein TadG